MEPRFTYRHSGLAVASALELPEWDAFAQACDLADVRVVIEEGPCPDCPADGSAGVGEADVRFAIDGIGGWQVERGETIRLHPDAQAEPSELRLFTLGSAWGALGYQRGFAMWHGSAVAREGRAILFCGDAGAGKSTMAAALLARGAMLVADDLSRVEPGGIHPSSARIKLWGPAIDLLGWRDRVLQRDYFRDDKFHCSVPLHAAGQKPLPLAGIVVLEEGESLGVERLTGGAAMRAAMQGTIYRPEMLEAMGRWGEQGVLAAQIVAAAPVWRLTRPKSFAALDEICAAAERLWQQD